MKTFRRRRSPLVRLVVPVCLLASILDGLGKDAPMPPKNEAVERATAAAHLRAVAASTTDPDVWLGLSLFPQPGDPVGPELSEMAVKSKPEYGPIASVVRNAMDGVDEQSANELIRRDPNNALGYYFLASRLYGPGKEKEMLAAFRKGAACPELRLYGESISNVLFKALDALGLKGRERLCASSWMATRWGNFEIGNLQAQATLLRRLAKHADLATQNEISDMMLMLAGQVIASDMQYHERFGNDALRQAFRLKAQIAAGEKSPMMNGYVGVVQALVSTRPDGSGLKRDDPRALALHIPGSIWYAFEVIDPKIARDYFPEMRGHVGADQAFEDAYQNWAKTSEALIEAALPDSDEIIGAYFHGHVPLPSDAPGPWVTSHTYVERLMSKKPDLLKAAAAYNAARQVLGAVVHAEQAAPKQAEPPSRDPVTAAKNECAENLRRIDSVKQQWALEMGRQATDVPIWEDLRPYLAPPTCPSGGIYTLGTVGEKPKCSIAGHLCP